MTASHQFTTDAARLPLHAVEPSETDDTRVWHEEPETPSETLNRWIADTFGPGSLGRRA